MASHEFLLILSIHQLNQQRGKHFSQPYRRRPGYTQAFQELCLSRHAEYDSLIAL